MLGGWGGGAEWSTDCPQRLWDMEGVFKVKAPLLCIILSNEGRGDSGSCQTMEQERVHTLFLSPSSGEWVGEWGVTWPRGPGPPPLTWDKTSFCTPTTLATVAWFSSTLYHARAGTLHVPLFDLFQLQGCQLLLSTEQQPFLSRSDEQQIPSDYTVPSDSHYKVNTQLFHWQRCCLHVSPRLSLCRDKGYLMICKDLKMEVPQVLAE